MLDVTPVLRSYLRSTATTEGRADSPDFETKVKTLGFVLGFLNRGFTSKDYVVCKKGGVY